MNTDTYPSLRMTKENINQILELSLLKHNNKHLIQADNIPKNIRSVKIRNGLKYYYWSDIEKLVK